MNYSKFTRIGNVLDLANIHDANAGDICFSSSGELHMYLDDTWAKIGNSYPPNDNSRVIRTKCPHCGAALPRLANFGSNTVRCNYCRSVVQIY